MKGLIVILSLLYSLGSFCQCEGKFQELVTDTTVVLPCDSMVLMNVETYANYYHRSESLKEVSKVNKNLRMVVDSLQKIEYERAVVFNETVNIGLEVTEENKKWIERNKKPLGGVFLFTLGVLTGFIIGK